ncbi:glucosamine-6-phosphate deaminase [Anoxybacillus suryakundensis]|uniref:Glucosamine-6-phosphate deaminase n=1 Tax=Anoxybacillus suryakundensis TaxID=1325335 RepID=A0A0K6GPG1_9BACL|nr:glucosamine-6-phosphate deaminase [Anoxybacillus suryakundensis]CUA80416.1 glucosamine-6-phosphate isomerase [Anoxybacillus suryakundensis]
MRIIQVNDYADMSQKAAELISDQVRKKRDSVLGLATGETMLGTYAALVKEYQQNNTSYREVRTFNLDEYIGLDATHPNSYRHYMHEQLFRFLDIPLSQTHIPNGCAPLLEEECARYEQLIEQCGGIDLQLLGIGQNGHIGFNEPGTLFASTTHVVRLSESTRKANARFFSSADEVPTHAITMGIATIMKSKQILLLASGERKAWAISRLLEGEVTTDVPASILKTHPNVIMIADDEALSLVSQEKRKVYRP